MKLRCLRGLVLLTSTGSKATQIVFLSTRIADGIGGYGAGNGWRRSFEARRFDVAMLFQNAFDAAWLAWRAGIPTRIGYARDARGWLLDQGGCGS